MSKKVELTGFTIKTEDGSLRLTIEEAKALYDQLHSLFGEKIVYVPSAPIVIEQPPWWPNIPVTPYIPPPTIDPNPYPPYSPTTIPSDPPHWPTIICHGNAIGDSVS